MLKVHKQTISLFWCVWPRKHSSLYFVSINKEHNFFSLCSSSVTRYTMWTQPPCSVNQQKHLQNTSAFQKENNGLPHHILFLHYTFVFGDLSWQFGRSSIHRNKGSKQVQSSCLWKGWDHCWHLGESWSWKHKAFGNRSILVLQRVLGPLQKPCLYLVQPTSPVYHICIRQSPQTSQIRLAVYLIQSVGSGEHFSFPRKNSCVCLVSWIVFYVLGLYWVHTHWLQQEHRLYLTTYFR